MGGGADGSAGASGSGRQQWQAFGQAAAGLGSLAGLEHQQQESVDAGLGQLAGAGPGKEGEPAGEQGATLQLLLPLGAGAVEAAVAGSSSPAGAGPVLWTEGLNAQPPVHMQGQQQQQEEPTQPPVECPGHSWPQAASQPVYGSPLQEVSEEQSGGQAGRSQVQGQGQAGHGGGLSEGLEAQQRGRQSASSQLAADMECVS